MLQDNRCLPQAGSGYFLSCYFNWHSASGESLPHACRLIQKNKKDSVKISINQSIPPLKSILYSFFLGGKT
jgi:hypothetical protein